MVDGLNPATLGMNKSRVLNYMMVYSIFIHTEWCRILSINSMSKWPGALGNLSEKGDLQQMFKRLDEGITKLIIWPFIFPIIIVVWRAPRELISHLGDRRPKLLHSRMPMEHTAPRLLEQPCAIHRRDGVDEESSPGWPGLIESLENGTPWNQGCIFESAF